MNKSVYRAVILVYLFPLLISIMISNTNATGAEAHVTSMMFGFILALIAYTCLPWISSLLGIDMLKAKGVEWIYNAAMMAFAAYTWLWTGNLNASTTDFLVSNFALLWHWVSIFIALLAFAAFWAVKGEQLKHMAHEIAD